MNHELVRRGWITSAQFGLDFGLSRIPPGINLIALAVILGYRLNGLLGSIVSGIAFVVPFSLITLVLTIGFVSVTSNPIGGGVAEPDLQSLAGLATFLMSRVPTH